MRNKPESLQEHLDMVIARLAGYLGRHHVVIKKLQRLHRHHIDSFELHEKLGIAYYAIAEVAKAYNHWQECLRINPQAWGIRRRLEEVEEELVLKNSQVRGEAKGELFLRHVSTELKKNKTGLAIAIIADENVGGNITTLMHAINRYTPHSARAVSGKSTWLGYEQDLVLDRPKDQEEAREVILKADFYHIGRMAPDFLDISFSKLLSARNCVFQYWGSELRKNGPGIREFHQKTGIRAITYPDWTLLEQLPDAFIVNKMIDPSIYPQIQNTSEKIFRVAHSPTARTVKSTDFFLETLKNLGEKYPIEPLIIEKLSFKDALERKATAHITFDQIHIGMYGASSLEALCMRQPVLCGLNNFIFYLFSDIPIIPVTHSTLSDTIIHLWQNPKEREAIGAQGPPWVEAHHSMAKLAVGYVFIYDMIINGVRKISFPEIKQKLKCIK